MKVLILHDEVAADARSDEADVLVQADVVASSLVRNGHRVRIAPIGLDLADASQRVRGEAPDVVFNLVESVARTGRLIHVVPALLESLRVPFTGAGADAVYLTSNKRIAKRLLRAEGLPTPDAATARSAEEDWAGPGRYLVKSVWEHGSVGIDRDSVVDVQSPQALRSAIERLESRFGGDGIAERYVDGREFNLSVLAGAAGPEVLPPAEIRFVDWDPTGPRIVDYRAKWDSDSHEYRSTPRSFELAAGDRPLVTELERLALHCWRAFGLRGYARVDFRVDEAGRPWILEINTNPCLSPDAGFAAAVAHAGLSTDVAISRILADTH